jgi:thymidylate synthase
VVLEPLPATALTAQEARDHMTVLERLVKIVGYDPHPKINAPVAV